MVLERRQLMVELYELIQTLDPATFKAELNAAAEEMAARLKAHVNELLEKHPLPDSVKEQLQTLKETMEQRRTQLTHDAKEEWQKLFKRLQPAYENMAASLRNMNIKVPLLRQTNYQRSFFHALNGLWTLLMVQHGFGYWGNTLIISALFTAAAVCEISRRVSPAWNDTLMAFFADVSHPHEAHKINSATWYLLALTLLAAFAEPVGQAVAVVVLALADPAAGLLGRRFGRIKLVGNKSLVGTTAFALVAFAATMAVLGIYYAHLPLTDMLMLAAVAATIGAFAELFTMSIDDNFTIPVTVGFGLSLALVLL